MFAPFRKHKSYQSLPCATMYHVRLSGKVWHIDKATDSPVFYGRLDKLSDTGKSLVYQKIFTA